MVSSPRTELKVMGEKPADKPQILITEEMELKDIVLTLINTVSRLSDKVEQLKKELKKKTYEEHSKARNTIVRDARNVFAGAETTKPSFTEIMRRITLTKEFCAQSLSLVWLMFIHKAEVER